MKNIKLFDNIDARIGYHIHMPRRELFALFGIAFLLLTFSLFVCTCGLWVIVGILLLVYCLYLYYTIGRLWRKFYSVWTFLFLFFVEFVCAAGIVYHVFVR